MVAAHPTRDTLAAFARGNLAPTELAAVAEHVAGCAACGRVIAGTPAGGRVARARSATQVIPAATRLTDSQPAGETPGVPGPLAHHPRYRVLGELGAGGMGVVYKAEDRLMGRVVALKVVAPHLTARSGAVERFLKEVRAAARLNNPNIVTAYDTGEAGGSHFLVMEFVEGTSLDRLVAKKGPLAVPLACSLARQAALGLQHAHTQGMVHRDIKPHNLMVTRKGQIKVMDFGLARFARSDEDESPADRGPFGGWRVADPVTNPHLLLGTPDYMAPEQAKNSHEVDTRSDVYSLGCTLFFLLTGRPPFAHAPTLIDKLLAHTEEPPPAIRALRPDVPEGVADVLAKMLAKNPADRYAAPAEVATALHPFTRTGDAAAPGGIKSGVVEAIVVTRPVPAPVPDEAPPACRGDSTVADEAEPRKKQSRPRPARRKWLLGTAAAVVVLAAVALGSGKKTGASARETPPSGQPQAKEKTGNKGENPWTNGGKTAHERRVLYVVPDDGLYLDDYRPVRQRLEAAGVKVLTASGKGGRARTLAGGERTSGWVDSVAVDLKLTAEMDVKPFAAVVFCGYAANEYLWPNGVGSAAEAAGEVLCKMRDGGRVIAAICAGEKILAGHGMLKGKRAASPGDLIKNFQPGPAAGPIHWEDKPIVTDGRVVTAADSRSAVPFAEAILAAIKE